MTSPYATYLENREPLKVISETPGQLERLSNSIGQRIDQPRAPGKWSAREVLCHLADCETVFAFRIRQTLAEDHHVIQPFDQDAWAKNYSGCTAAEALAMFSAVRNWNVKLLNNLPKPAFSKKVKHPERGEMTLQTIVETMGGHDLNHLKQLEEIASKKAAAS